jgi:hypothetical protein
MAAAAGGMLSFFMLFPSWIRVGEWSANAFGDFDGLNVTGTIGPVMILIMSLSVVALACLGMATGAMKYSAFALFSASMLLVVYIVEVGVVSAFTDQAAKGEGVDASVGSGLWLGLTFSLITVSFLTLFQVLRNGLVSVKIIPGSDQDGAQQESPHPRS